MATPIAGTLREMRLSAGWSLARLAHAAGVDKSTLSRWEAGARQPCVPELEAVLRALHASPAQRAFLLARLGPPRAARRLREIAPDLDLPSPPSAGDLFRALRLRRGWTQEQAAAAVGVSRPALTRWERGERLPSTEERQALLYHLGAREEEVAALSVVGSEPSRDGEGPNADPRQTAIRRLEAVNSGRHAGQEDLHYLLLERWVWEQALHDGWARQLLARVYAHHGQHLFLERRWAESRAPADRALALAREPGGDTVTLARAVLLKADILTHEGQTTAALRLLRPLCEHGGAPPEYAAWALAVVAQSLAASGRPEAAVAFAERACRVAEECENPVEHYLRRCDLGERLVDAGRPREALAAAPEPPADYQAADRVPALLLRARALHAAGCPAEAYEQLRETFRLVHSPALRRLRLRAESLAARL